MGITHFNCSFLVWRDGSKARVALHGTLRQGSDAFDRIGNAILVLNRFIHALACCPAALSMAMLGYSSNTAAQPAASAYPSKPIRIIIPNPPGGATDFLGRLVGRKLTESWGQVSIADNRGGGNGVIAGEALMRSPPDGHTLLLVSSTHIITPLLHRAPYDAVKDFAAVATIGTSEFLLVLHPSVPANNLKELIALAKSRPAELNHASAGSGTPGRLALEMFNIRTGVKITNISYKGAGPALNDLIGGQLHMFLNIPLNFIPHIKSGKIKAIAISGESRLPALPHVPTFTEAGLPGFDVRYWYGVLAPVPTPKDITDKLSVEIAKIVASADIKERLSNLGVDPLVSTSEQYAALIAADSAKYARTIKTANIRVED